MKKTLALLLLTLVMTACSADINVEPSTEILEQLEIQEDTEETQNTQQATELLIQSAKAEQNNVILTFTNGEEKQINYRSGLNLDVELGNIRDVKLSTSKKFLSIETAQGGSIGVVVHDITNNKNYASQSHMGTLTWEGDLLIIDNKGTFEDFSVYQSVSDETPWKVELISNENPNPELAIYDSCGQLDDDKYTQIRQQLSEQNFINYEEVPKEWMHNKQYIRDLCYSESKNSALILVLDSQGLGNLNLSVVDYNLSSNSFTTSNKYNYPIGKPEFQKRDGNIIPIKIGSNFPDLSIPDNPKDVEKTSYIYYNLDTQTLATEK